MIAALVAGALAVAGPSAPPMPLAELWELELDRSPSMFLAVEEGRSRTRYELALEMALAELEAREVPARARRWSTPGLPAVVAEAPPRSWGLAPRLPVPELGLPPAAGRLRVTDRLPAYALLPRGGVASGGPAVPGPIAASAGRWLLWDGAAIVDGGPAAPRGVWIDPALAGPLRELIELWAEERGLGAVPDPDQADLVLGVVSGGESRPVRLEQGTWWLTGSAVPAPAEAETFSGVHFEAQDGAPLLWSPGAGRLATALTSVERLGGDPAACALAWGQLLDRALLPPPGLVSYAERQAAGEPRRVAPSPREAPRGERPAATPPGAYLALLALLLALAALSPTLGRRSPIPFRRRGPFRT
jgi:hypothetical protein